MNEEWTPEYVDELLGQIIAHGVVKVADAHNAALAAERSNTVTLANTLVERDLQLAAEQEKVEGALHKCHRRCSEKSEGGKMSEEYDDVLPVSLYRAKDGVYHLLDRHNDELATFGNTVEVEDMERIVAAVNGNNAALADERGKVQDWTAGYAQKLELNYGWEGVAHNHNAALAAEREMVQELMNEVTGWHTNVTQLRSQLASEREQVKGELANGASLFRRTVELEKQLAAERDSHAEEMEQWHTKFQQLRSQLAAEREEALKISVDAAKTASRNLDLRGQLAAERDKWQRLHAEFHQQIKEHQAEYDRLAAIIKKDSLEIIALKEQLAAKE